MLTSSNKKPKRTAQIGKRSLTPLWVVSIFVSLTETVLGVGVIQTTGGIQIALTVFVMAFATLVALGFFLVLWFRNYVFYPPAEFAQVDVSTYVAAMRNSSLASGDRLYSQVEQAVRTVLSSQGTALKLKTFIEDKNRIAPANLNQMLQAVATEAVEEIRKVSFVTVDSTSLDKERGTLSQIPYDQEITVGGFLDRVYFAINKNSPIADAILLPFTYEKSWVLRDRDSGFVFHNIGTKWSWQEGKQSDDRSLSDVGISAGMFLQAIRVAQTQAS
jgi:hypothetical protein